VKHIVILPIIFILGCGQQSNIDENSISKYRLHPANSDSMCIKELNRAKADVKKGKIVFCMPMGFGSFQLRHEEQLKQLCNKHNIVFDYELFSDVIITGQTQGCYGAYMDKVIADKFGNNFKKNLLEQADSILLASNDPVPYYLCDKRPQIAANDDSDRLFATVPIKLKKQLKPDKEDRFPFMDIGFYIDKEGNSSNFFLNYFHDVDNKINDKFKDELFNLGVEQLKAIKHWETGIVAGQKVITENNVRVYF